MTEPTKELQSFDVEVTRIVYGTATITVQAANAQEADELAIDEAGGHSFS